MTSVQITEARYIKTGFHKNTAMLPTDFPAPFADDVRCEQCTMLSGTLTIANMLKQKKWRDIVLRHNLRHWLRVSQLLDELIIYISLLNVAYK